MDSSYCLVLYLADTEGSNFECCRSSNFKPLPLQSGETVGKAVSTLRASGENLVSAE